MLNFKPEQVIEKNNNKCGPLAQHFLAEHHKKHKVSCAANISYCTKDDKKPASSQQHCTYNASGAVQCIAAIPAVQYSPHILTHSSLLNDIANQNSRNLHLAALHKFPG